MSIFTERLRKEIDRIGVSELARSTGFARNSLYNWCEKGNIPLDKLLLLGEYGVDVDYVVSNKSNSAQNIAQNLKFEDEFDLVNVYDVAISAGHGSICAGDAKPISRLAFRKDWLSKNGLYSKDLIIVHATGDSMFPTIEDKEPLLVNTIDKSLTDGFIYVIRTGEHFWVKRIQRQIDGSILLISDNKTYPPMQLDLNEASDIEILGKWIPPSRGTFY
ncbi:S24 family peptidase [Acinetobacter haemolyticus]|uniref:LexA family transcriptional regulator n=1 Tax=Acinetobacter haemolyticus TaxID=29430 RepID=UPI002A6B4375|nr:S24 family peptidase [Acinetobacter haemolyticus]WPO67580.1 S24 family peptidase [Acinetobacter haemolyticus]